MNTRVRKIKMFVKKEWLEFYLFILEEHSYVLGLGENNVRCKSAIDVF